MTCTLNGDRVGWAEAGVDMSFGDRVRIEMLDAAGGSAFEAIGQVVERG